jgi:membrane protein DedA with SNARE-associated domain
MPYPRYLAYDAVGALLWATVWILAGVLLGDQWIAWTTDDDTSTIGAVLAGAATAAVTIAIVYRVWRRHQSLTRHSGS